MKVEEYDGRQEREVLLAMITSSAVLARIAVRWDGKLFASPEANRIGEWCVEHQRKYNEAPGKGIASYHDEWASAQPDKEAAKLVGKLLAGLSDEFEQNPVNPEHTIDVAARRFNRNRLVRLADEIKADIQAGKVNRADERVSKYSKVDMGAGGAVDLFIDEEAVRSTFAVEHSEPLITFPGPIGGMFAGTLHRDGFFVFWGPQKWGKSHWITRLAWQALLQRRRVAYFQVGDMPEREIKERLLMLASRRPARSPTEQWPVALQIPTEVEMDGTTPLVSYRERVIKGPLNGDRAWLACQDLMQTKVRSKRSFFKLFTFPTITIPGIKAALENYERVYQWVPDVVCIDYLDNIEAVDRKLDRRDQINSVWHAARILALEKHCLVISASQVKAEAFRAAYLDRHHFSENSHKLDHPSALCGIFGTAEEKEAGVVRLNLINCRHKTANPKRHWFVGGCLAIADPCIVSADPVFVGASSKGSEKTGDAK